MAVERVTIEGIAIFRPDGRFTRDLGNNYLVSDVEDVLEEGRQLVIFNLLLCPLMDSFGLGILLRAQKMIANQGGKLVLVGVSSRVMRLIDMAHLNQHFQFYDSEQGAITALRVQRGIEQRKVS